MVVRVIELVRPGGLPRGDDTSGAAIARPRRGNRVFSVVAPRTRWQQPLPIAENRAVLAVRKRPAGLDQDQGLANLNRQLVEVNGLDERSAWFAGLGRERQQPQAEQQQAGKQTGDEARNKAAAVVTAINAQRGKRLSSEVEGKDEVRTKFGEFAQAVGLRRQP